MYVIDTNNGIGIIRQGKQEPICVNGNLIYQEFDKNREAWLNLKPVSWFRRYEKNRRAKVAAGIEI